MTAAVFSLAALFLVSGFLLGAGGLYWYMVLRCRKNLIAEGGDASNLHNPMRIIEHVVLHGADFGQLYYVTSGQFGRMVVLDSKLANEISSQRPFDYIYEDEHSEVVGSRPPED